MKHSCLQAHKIAVYNKANQIESGKVKTFIGCIGLIMVGILMLIIIPAKGLAQAGTISDVDVAQRTDGSGIVDIYFRLNGLSTSAYNIVLDVSFEGDDNYQRIFPNYLNMSLNQVAPSNELIHVEWDGLASFPYVYSEESVLKFHATLHGYSPPGTVADIEGHVYPTVVIGSQEWMKENLRTTRYNDGSPIPGSLSNEEWSTTAEGAYAVYAYGLIEGLNSPAEVSEAYGNLYNWYAADDERGLCPTGWRVPGYDDWLELWYYAVNNYNEINSGNIGNHFKSCRQVDSRLDGDCDTSEHPRWNSNDIHYGNDYFGFSLLPGGERLATGQFFANGSHGWWWTSTPSPDIDSNAYYAITNNNVGGLAITVFNGGSAPEAPGYKSKGYAVRCIKNSNP